jgi:hypothetical protein
LSEQFGRLRGVRLGATFGAQVFLDLGQKLPVAGEGCLSVQDRQQESLQGLSPLARVSSQEVADLLGDVSDRSTQRSRLHNEGRMHAKSRYGSRLLG